MMSLEEDFCWASTGLRPVSISLVFIPWCVEAQTLPGTLVSCTELCELFLPGGPPGIDWHSSLPGGETRGRVALGLLLLGQWSSACCPAPDKLKLRPFLVLWSPALSCVSSSAQVGPMALSGIDGKPGGRVVLGPHRPQASVLQPGARPPGVLKLRPSLAPWSPAELCELFLPGGPPGIDWHSELLHPAGPLALTGIVLREMHHPINESRVTAFITHTFKIDRWASDDSLLRLLCLLI
ncbi:uncharacterized protein isoform X3 [Macaca fascicularis]|uniref:uncharacterized protein isoform X3 n=1 Tax=Macaca fascicularis TaxID=9541 RepID=UPI003D15BB04